MPWNDTREEERRPLSGQDVGHDRNLSVGLIASRGDAANFASRDRVGARRRCSCWTLELTGRETEVLILIAEGLSNFEIAAMLFLSEATVAHHAHAMITKASARNRTELAGVAVVDPVSRHEPCHAGRVG